MNPISNLAWKLNWYRHSEMEGALLLGRVIRSASDPKLLVALTRHSADEARHAWLWAKTIGDLGLPIVPIFRSYQSFYAKGGGLPASLPEVLALTHVFEKRVDMQFTLDLQNPDLPVQAGRTFRALLADERDHLDWVARWLAAHPDGPALVAKYEKIDRDVYAELEPYMDRISDVPGLSRAMTH